MTKTPRYTVKKYIIWIVSYATVGLTISVVLLRFFGFPQQGILLVVLLSFPIVLYAALKGFHKGLVDYYGFKEPKFQEEKKPNELIK